jgi:hypothetical protein
VISGCKTVSGVVMAVRSESDGDFHVLLALDPAFRGLLNSANVQHQHGWLVTEIVPADEPGCAKGRPPRPASGSYDYGICSGADIFPPAVGSRISVTGPYVLDTDHGWMEIHPIWVLRVLP